MNCFNNLNDDLINPKMQVELKRVYFNCDSFNTNRFLWA
ncbi:hypothetical protein GRAQ_01745 [Rahnella aquatilis CIP 78.65 = ATCC 33071]|nr:hypothetical protein GRAQ_01745 [Rahnella aquatilis CIP 78.65 = ATCC 33071]